MIASKEFNMVFELYLASVSLKCFGLIPPINIWLIISSSAPPTNGLQKNGFSVIACRNEVQYFSTAKREKGPEIIAKAVRTVE